MALTAVSDGIWNSGEVATNFTAFKALSVRNRLDSIAKVKFTEGLPILHKRTAGGQKNNAPAITTTWLATERLFITRSAYACFNFATANFIVSNPMARSSKEHQAN